MEVPPARGPRGWLPGDGRWAMEGRPVSSVSVPNLSHLGFASYLMAAVTTPLFAFISPGFFALHASFFLLLLLRLRRLGVGLDGAGALSEEGIFFC